MHYRRRRRRICWVSKINRDRDTKGVYECLIKDLRLPENEKTHYQYLRMSSGNFNYLLEKLRPLLTKQDTVMRKAIVPEVKLAITLHHLAEGTSFRNISAHYRLGRRTVSNIIYETCAAIWEVFQPIYMRPPSDDDWKTIAEEYVYLLLECVL